MSLALSPTAAALSRSITRLTRGLFISMSSETSCTSGSGAIAASRLRRPVVQVRRCRRSGPSACRCCCPAPANLDRRRQADERPEARESASSCGRSCCAICAAVTGRLRRGVSWTLSRAVFIDPMPPPVLAKNVSTYGLRVDDRRRPCRAFCDHVVVRRALRRLQVDVQRVVVLIGDEALRHDREHPRRSPPARRRTRASIAGRCRSTRREAPLVGAEQRA